MRLEHWFYSVPLRMRSLFRRNRVEQELSDELQYHLEKKTEQFMAEGMGPEQARRAALRAMDGLTQQQEACREAHGVNAIETTLQDLRYGARVLAKSPGFTAVAVGMLALAIGANAVVFGIMNALVLRPLNVPRADSLYMIELGKDSGAHSYPDYLDLREQNRSFEALAAYAIDLVSMDPGSDPVRAWAYETSGNYFDVLGIQPYAGRFFHAADERGPNSAPYVVLAYSYWQARFGGDRGAVGRTILLNKHPFTIVGVAPPEFRGTLLVAAPDFFMPLVNIEQVKGASVMGSNLLGNRGSRWVFVVMGHLKPGITMAQVTTDLKSIGSYLERTYPKEDSQMDFRLARPSLYGDFLGKPIKAFVAGLMLLAGLILLAACANLGGLFAARAADRSREVALRLALGSSRARILKQLLTEALLISLMGGAAGLWGSVILLKALSVWQPIPRFPLHVPVEPDAAVYAIALVLAIVSGVLFGLVPVRQVLRTDPYQIVKAGPGGALGRRLTVRDLLLGAQIAICAVLVTASLVAVRGLARSLHSNFGFEPKQALLVETDLDMAGYRGDAVIAMQRRMIDGVAAIPGVASVGLIDRPPLGGDWISTTVFKDETTDLRLQNVAANPALYTASPEYFQAAKTALLAGRTFSWHDDDSVPKVTVVNREFARRLFGSVPNALGRYFRRRNARYQVVGVVEDGKVKSLTEEPQPVMFLPILQSPSSGTSLVVRSNRDPQQLAAAIRNELRGLDSGLPAAIGSWSQHLDLVLFPSRVASVALGVLGVMGAMLSITGIFGMAAYAVSKRLRELGIRLALGAQRAEVLQAALGRAVRLLAVGSAVGLLLGLLSTRVLAAIVYQATPHDPLVLAGVILAMLGLGLFATWIPAQRALALDPSKLLREE